MNVKSKWNETKRNEEWKARSPFIFTQFYTLRRLKGAFHFIGLLFACAYLKMNLYA